MRLIRIVFHALVGACAGAAAGIIIVALVAAISSIPYIVTHSGPKNDPFTMFGAAVVVYGIFYGLGFGAPVGAVLGLVTGLILEMRSGRSLGKTARSPVVPLDDAFTIAAKPPADGFPAAPPPSSRRSCGLVAMSVLAIPGAVILLCLLNGRREGVAFDRLEAGVRRLGGHAEVENESTNPLTGTIDSVFLDLSATGARDADLERLTHIEMFRRVRDLNLAGTPITDRGVASLEHHPGLYHLNLSRTRITDRCLHSLARVYVSSLNLSGTAITDAALPLLNAQAGPGRLSHIDLTDTALTEEKVRELGKAQNQVVITYGTSKSPKHSR